MKALRNDVYAADNMTLEILSELKSKDLCFVFFLNFSHSQTTKCDNVKIWQQDL